MSTQNPIFREYIDAADPFWFPAKNINDKIDQFHFIVGFLRDNNGTGNFSPNGNFDFLSVVLQTLKKDHPNVKVIISIGGRGAKYPFNPAKPEEWIANARDSITRFIKKYDDLFDGIDINYEVVESPDSVFAYCIGNLIAELLNVHNINLVSIAPSKSVSQHYKQLYSDYKDNIHFVDYQFYDEKISSKDEFKTLFRSLLQVYGSDKLLAGYSTDPNDAGLQLTQEDFIDCVKQLFHSKTLVAGVFIWNDYYSVFSKPPFNLEIKIQKILTNTYTD